MNKNLLIAAVGAALTVAGPAVYAIEGKVSGQVNRAIMQADDGKVSDTHFVDNAISGSRFRFTGTADMMPGVKAGINYEVEFLSNASNAVSNMPVSGHSTTGSFTDRIIEVYFQGAFGQLSLGQGLGAADGGIEVDLSGTSVISTSNGSTLGGAIAFNSVAAGVLTPTTKTITSTIADQDFESRYDRLRYDTPAFGPVKASFSSGETTSGHAHEAAIWLNADLGGAGKLAGAIGLSTEDSATILAFQNRTRGGSLSWLAPFGLSITAAHSNATVADVRKGKFTYLKVGYKLSAAHAVSVETAEGVDQAAVNDEAKEIGLGYVFSPKPWADLYAGYKIYSLERPDTTYDDIKILTIGSRLKF